MYFIFVKHENFNYILYRRIQVVNLEEVINMKKTTLYLIADIVNSVESSNQKLYDLLDTMNLSPDERDKVLESIYVIVEKIEQIKRSNIGQLEDHIDIEQLERISRF